MGNNEFAVRLVAGLLEARTGQKLNKDRHWRIETALSGLLRERSIASVEQLVNQLMLPGQNELAQAIVEALLNNETYFYRDRAMFDMLAGRILPDLAKHRAASRRLSIWSAGCSSGQEAYSLAMMFLEQSSRWAGWTIDIVGTDVSQAVVKSAREACYTSFQIQRGLGVQQMLAHFDETEKGWQASRTLQRMVRFQVHNILEPAPTPGGFDLILCRNVLLYFDADTRRRALDRIAQAMAPGAVLMLGGGETTVGHSDNLRPCKDFSGFFRAGNARKEAHVPRARLAG
jgi:chemotaxis protein methyltransferase CheR